MYIQLLRPCTVIYNYRHIYTTTCIFSAVTLNNLNDTINKDDIFVEVAYVVLLRIKLIKIYTFVMLRFVKRT